MLNGSHRPLRALAMVLFMAFIAGPVQAQFKVSWTADGENLRIVGAKSPEKEYTISRLSVRGGLYLPGEKVMLSLACPAKPAQDATGGSIKAVPFNTGQFDATENGFVHPSGARRIELTGGVPVLETPLSSFKATGDEMSGEVALPDAYGMYALVLARPDGSQTLLGSIARVPKPQARVGRYRQLMGEWGLPGGEPWARVHNDKDVAQALVRAGIGLVRKEIQSGIAKVGDPKDGVNGSLDGFFAANRDAGIEVMITAGCHTDPDRKAAGAWMTRQLPPSYDPQLTQWYANFARRYWTGGESGLWAVEHFNEPWEPEGISGWNSDSQRYRQILKCLHDGVKSVDRRIKVVGTGSVMNTEDKLLAGDSRESIGMLDLLSDHYVSLFAAYGARVAEKYGIVSGETETWGVHSQVLAAQFLTQYLSNGQKWINPAHQDMLWDVAPGNDRDLANHPMKEAKTLGVITPTPSVVAMAVWNAMIQDREFKRLAFTDHVPYLYQFGEDNDARLVLCGRLISINSTRVRDNPWWQLKEGPTGSIRVADPQRVFDVKDLNGNPVPRDTDGSYKLVLDTRAYYLSSAKGAEAVVEAVRAGEVEGLRAVHIAPSGVAGVEAGTTLPVTLHNFLNRTITGRLSAEGLNPQKPVSFTSTTEIPAGAEVAVKIPLSASVFGGLPMQFVFTPDAPGLAPTKWTEVIQPTVISRLTASADSTKWESLPGATVLRPEGDVKGNEIEAIWLPFIQKQKMAIAARRGEVKLGYDQQGLHLVATVDAKSIRQRPRLATRDDDAYFRNLAKDETKFAELRPYAAFLAIRNDGKIWGGEKRQWYVTAADEPGWQEYQNLLKQKPELKRLVESGEAKRWAEAQGQPGKSTEQFKYVYLPGGAGFMDQLPFSGDAFQFAINMDPASEAMTKTHDLKYPSSGLPAYWGAVPDSDYEFSLYQCADGKAELWCLLAPGVPRGHYFPHQERGKINQHAVKAECSVTNANGVTTYRATIPWSELGGKPWSAGSDVGFTFVFNAADGGGVAFGDASGATKTNSLTMHPYWLPKASNTIRWTLLP